MRYLKVHPLLERMGYIKYLDTIKDVFDSIEDDLGLNVEYKFFTVDGSLRLVYDLNGNLIHSLNKPLLPFRNNFGELIKIHQHQ